MLAYLRSWLSGAEQPVHPKNVLTIQYLRGIAASIVVVHHLLSSPDLDYLFQPLLGDFGVDIFFVISGFVMWFTTSESVLSPFQFWCRRIIRIVPLYWIFLAALIIIALLLPEAFNSTKITLQDSIKSYMFVPHYHAVQHIIAPILIPGWSLNYEMFFYFIFGLSLFLRPLTLRFVSLAVTLIGLVLAGQALHSTNAIVTTYTNLSLIKFLEGIILAIVYRSGLLKSPILGVAIVLAGLCWQFIFFFQATGYWLPEMISLPPALIVGGSLALEKAARRLPSLVLRVVGDASYSIYLSHLFFLKLVEIAAHHLLSLGRSGIVDAAYVAIAFAFSISGGILIYYAIERPMTRCLREGSDWRSRLKSSSPAASL